MFRPVAQLLAPQIFTGSQIQVPIDVNPLLNTTADCLRFVTEFFEVISQSAPHIYHSALLLAPKSSVVQKLYGEQVCSPARVVTGIPASWDSCTASLGDASAVSHATWSPHGQFVAVCFQDRVGIRDSTTLERVSDLRLPTSLTRVTPDSLAFSPDGHLLACTYHPVVEPNMLVSSHYIPIYTHLHIQVKYMCISLYCHLGHPNRCDHQEYSHLGHWQDCILQRPKYNHSHQKT